MKIVKRLICWALLISAVCVGISGLRSNKVQGKAQAKKNIIITLWHMDTFEGGTGSRQDFLMQASLDFEKRYNGVYISVIGYTPEEAEENIKKGIYPDMVSYGMGFDLHKNMREIKAASQYNCKANGVVCAVAWCRGGYVLISHSENFDDGKISDIIISKGKYTSPEISLALSGYKDKTYSPLPPLNAYTEFLNDKQKTLLGTQRDIYRLRRREVQFSAKSLGGFSDLFQYISVFTGDEERNFYCQKFIENLLGKTCQQKLTQIGMFPVINTKIYTDDSALSAMENARPEFGISVFSDREKVQKMQEIAEEIINGNNKNADELRSFVQWK